jgi:hypothetical protein
MKSKAAARASEALYEGGGKKNPTIFGMSKLLINSRRIAAQLQCQTSLY